MILLHAPSALGHLTRVEVHSDGEQSAGDGHESLRVVVGVQGDAADPLVDGVHQEGVHAYTRGANGNQRSEAIYLQNMDTWRRGLV